MMVCMADTVGISERDVVMPVVPMFHVNAWGMPFAAVWMGPSRCSRRPGPDPHTLRLIQDER